SFSPAIKRCGVDAVFFKGASAKPVYLYMDNESCELRDASEYWGMDAVEAEEKLIADNKKKTEPKVAVIGTSGEKLSLISGIVNDGGRIAARSGVGAVMGSKKLKAVVLSGNKAVECSDRQKIIEQSKKLAAKIKKAYPPGMMKAGTFGLLGSVLGMLPKSMPLDGSSNIGPLSKWGSSVNTVMGVNSGDGPVKNWGGCPKDAKDLGKNFSPDKLFSREIKKYHCYSCTLGCGAVIDTKDIHGGEFARTHKPEYETLDAFGALITNNNLESVLYINELLNRAGMDSISAGHTVAYAIECFENGLINKYQTGGLELKWGNHEDVIKLVKMMIAREGIGDKLADGVKKAVEHFGWETSKYAMHIGGQEPGLHDPRQDLQLAVHFVTEAAPGKHTIGSAATYGNMAIWDICSWAPVAKPAGKKEARLPNENTGKASAANACYTMLVDGAGGCYYGQIMGTNNWKVVDYLNAASGWNRTGDEYMEIGRRIQILRTMFNIKHGINPMDRRLPDRMEGNPPLKNGPLKNATINTQAQVKYHWQAMGCNPSTGEPLDATLEKLNMKGLLGLDVSAAAGV
ncbi:MAG: hypothetical protein FWH38_04160, partial [Treponema sp.]|nr:hypothetical protein [Treponema sp.]